MKNERNRASEFFKYWSLAPEIIYLNHGSFGGCPIEIQNYQSALRSQLESQPIDFFIKKLEPMLDTARESLADFVGAPPENIAFVPNATTGVSTVLRSLEFRPGDELLTTDHEYPACKNALEFVAQKSGAKIKVAELPYPASGPDEVFDAILRHVNKETRLLLIDHITSPTAMMLPVTEVTRELDSRGIDTLIDGAHAPGMLDLDISAINPAYYTGNCHKWLCAPRGAAFLFVREDRRDKIRPLAISNGASSARRDRSRFRLEFDWVGTNDYTASLCVPEAIRYLGAMLPGGWPEIRRRNHENVIEARNIICDALKLDAPYPDEMAGSMASILIEGCKIEEPLKSDIADIQEEILRKHKIQSLILHWPGRPENRVLRISFHLHNSLEQYKRLAGILKHELSPGKKD